MSSHLETEIKLPVHSVRGLRRILADLSFEVVKKRSFERNILLDSAGSRLRRAKCLLRLRTVRHRNVLTFKASPRPTGRFKVRPEWEAEIRGAPTLKSVLKALGLKRIFRYEKFRTSYAPEGNVRRGLVELDETPIGNYLELEGSRRWIERTARTLGYTRADYITESYGRLYKLYCQERGLRPRNMVFRRRKS